MLISYLSNYETHLPFTDLEGLLESSYSFYTEPGTSYWDAFKQSNHHVWRNLYEKKLEGREAEYLKVMKVETEGFDPTMQWLLQKRNRAAYTNFMSLA